MTDPTSNAPAVVGMYSFRTPDPHRLARFWSELMGLPVSEASTADLVMLDFDHVVAAQTWLFERSADEAASTRLGLDIAGPDDEDWRALADRADALGAERVSEGDEGGIQWIEMRDPDGNRFRVLPPRRPPRRPE